MLRKIPPSFVLLLCSVLTLSLTSLSSAELVALYQFEDNANDSSGNNLHGKFVGQAKIVTDAVKGNVLSLDGQDSYVDCGTAPAFSITSRITIACWVKVNKFDKNWQTIIAKGDDSYRLSRAGSTNSSHFGCSGLSIQWFDGNINVNDGKWHHIAGVYDGSMMHLYVDGAPDEYRQTAWSINISKYPLVIGANAQVEDRCFNGLIDEVAIFNHALKAEQVRQLYRRGVESVSSTQEYIWSQVRIAVSSMERGDETAAEAVIERLLSEFSQDKDIAPAVLQVAESFRKLGKSQKANELYQHVVQSWPDSYYALLSQPKIGILSLELSDNEGLESAVDELLVNFADHEDAVENVYRLATECTKKQRLFVESRPDDTEQIRFYDGIIRRLTGYILARQPDSDYGMWAQKAIAFADIHIGDFASAEASIEKLIDDYPDHADLQLALYFFGNDYRRMAQDDKARQWYQYVIDRWPNHHFAVMSRASIAALNISLGDEETAKVLLDELITNFADHPALPEALWAATEAYYKLAFQYESQGLDSRADEYFTKVINTGQEILNRWPDTAAGAEIYDISAICYKRLGEYAKAIEYYQKVVDKWPDYEYAWNAQFLIGYIYERLGEAGTNEESEAHARTKAAYELVIQNYPNCLAVNAARGWLENNIDLIDLVEGGQK